MSESAELPCHDCGQRGEEPHSESCIADFAKTFDIPHERARTVLHCWDCISPEFCIDNPECENRPTSPAEDHQ